MPCHRLEEITTTHCDQTPPTDAFCIFLRTHLFICRSSPSFLIQLNIKCVDAIVDVYDRHNKGYMPKRRHWQDALAFYKRYPERSGLFYRMTAAHLIDDLPVIIAELGLDKARYDQFLTHVFTCIEATVRSGSGNNLFNQIRHIVDPEKVLPDQYIRDYAWWQSFQLKP